MNDRRRFIVYTVTTIAAGSLPAALVHAKRPGSDITKTPPIRAMRRFQRGRHLGKEEFQSLVDEVFYVYGGPAGVVDLQLISVKDGPGSRSVEQFFLDFRGPSSPSLESATYEAEHSRGNRFEIYLQEAGSDDEASYYSASFSHLI